MYEQLLKNKIVNQVNISPETDYSQYDCALLKLTSRFDVEKPFPLPKVKLVDVNQMESVSNIFIFDLLFLCFVFTNCMFFARNDSRILQSW